MSDKLRETARKFNWKVIALDGESLCQGTKGTLECRGCKRIVRRSISCFKTYKKNGWESRCVACVNPEFRGKHNPYSFEELAEIAKGLGYELRTLESEFKKVNSKLLLECVDCGYEWEKRGMELTQKLVGRCSICRGLRGSLNHFHFFAGINNFSLVENCKERDFLKATRYEIKCLECNTTVRKSLRFFQKNITFKCEECEKIKGIKEFKSHCEENGLIPTKVIKNFAREVAYRVSCIRCGSDRKRSLRQLLDTYRVLQRKGCTTCESGKNAYLTNPHGTLKWTPMDFQNEVEKKGFKLIDSLGNYKNSTTKLSMVCKNNHLSKYSMSDLLCGRGCRTCMYNGRKRSLAYINEKLEGSGIKCISPATKGENAFTIRKFQCLSDESHIMERSWIQVRDRLRCTICQSYFVGESCARHVLEVIFKNSFHNSKPDFLKIKKNGMVSRLELDGYCKDLKMAFEYNGRQHYEYVKFFHRNNKRFQEMKQRDIFKELICRQKGIRLIIIPEVMPKCNQEGIYNEVIRILKKQKIKIPKHSMKKALDYSSIKNLIEEAVNHAEKHGGMCLSKTCSKIGENLKFRCGDCSHEWWLTLGRIRRNDSWCKFCDGRRIRFSDKAEKLKKHNFLCLNPEDYKNRKTMLNWQCMKCGNQASLKYQAVYARMKRGGRGCLVCLENHGRRKSIKL